MLDERMAFRARMAKLRDPDDESVFAAIQDLLSLSVVDADNCPVYTKARWRLWGAAHESAAIDLFNAAMRLSGLSGDDTKKN